MHCSAQLQAQWKLKAITERLEQCGLRLNLEKTAIVYCKDSQRQEAHAHKQFTFLGYTFRPRGAKNRYGKLFDSFLPAVSLEATKKMLRTIKSWKLSRQTPASIGELASRYNPSCSSIGAPMAEPPDGRWEPYDGRLSRTVLREARGETPWPTDLRIRRPASDAACGSRRWACSLPEFSGCETELLLKLPNEMGAIAEPGAQRDFGDRFLGILQEPFGVAQASLAQIRGRRPLEFRLKQSCKLSSADTDLFGNPVGRHRPEQALFYQKNGAPHAWIGNAGVADCLRNGDLRSVCAIGHRHLMHGFRCTILSAMQSDQMRGKTDDGNAPGAAQAIAVVDIVDVRDGVHLRKHRFEFLHMIWMQADSASVEQPGACQHERSRADTYQRYAAVGDPQKVGAGLGSRLTRAAQKSADHSDIVKLAGIEENIVSTDFHAAAGDDRGPASRTPHDGPAASQLAAIVGAIGCMSQRIDQAGEGQQREFRPQHNPYVQLMNHRFAQTRIDLIVDEVDEFAAAVHVPCGFIQAGFHYG